MSDNTPKNCTIASLPATSEVLTYSTRWSRLDGNVLLSDEFRSLGQGAQVVYGYLGLFINHESRSWQLCLQLLADYTGYSKRHVRRCLAELEEAGLLVRRTVFWQSQAGARQSANVYTLTTPPSQRAGEGQLVLLPEGEGLSEEAAPSEPVAPLRVETALPPQLFEAPELPTAPQVEPPPSDAGGGGGTPMSGGGGTHVRPYTEKENSPDKTPSESCPPTPRASRGAPKADRGQVQVILGRYAKRADTWWALAARGDVGVVAEVLGLLRLLRSQGGPVSCRKRHIRASLVAAFEQLEDARAAQQAEAAERQAEQEAELARCLAEAELVHEAHREQRAQQREQANILQAQRTAQAEDLARQLEDLAEDFNALANPLPHRPEPSMTDARGLPPNLRAELVRYVLRNKTSEQLLQLAQDLRRSPLDVERHRRAQQLIEQHARGQEAA